MKRIIYLTSGLLILSLWTSGSPVQLKSFDSLSNALKEGSGVRVILHYKAMKLFDESGNPVEDVPDAVGGMDLDTFEYFSAGAVGNSEGYFASSHTHLINHPRQGFVLNYVKLRVYESGLVKIRAQYISPTDYSVKMDETFETEINDGQNNAGAFFFLN
jgi:hypothetical protein